VNLTRLVTRLVTWQDAKALAELAVANRDFLAPYEPDRDPRYYTVAGQDAVVRSALERHAAGFTLPHVITVDAQVVGRVTLNEIVRGPLQSCSLGYWVAEPFGGQGLATAAASELVAWAFGPLGLHRVQAGTLADNVRSQRVLERVGFVRYGLAPQYLHIAGAWRDHVLHQLLTPTAQAPGAAGPRVAG
jgi:[ribosomal protein S5]-alanine N-acetyltransferase